MKESPDARWDSALALIAKNVTPQQYKTWFKSLVFEKFDENKKTLLVQVPSPYVYEYLEENFIDLLSKVLRHTFCDGIQLQYRVVTDKEHRLTQVIEAEPEADSNKPQPRSRANEISALDVAGDFFPEKRSIFYEKSVIFLCKRPSKENFLRNFFSIFIRFSEILINDPCFPFDGISDSMFGT